MGALVTVPITVTLSLISLKPSDVLYWIKFVISYLYIRMTRWLVKGRFDLYDFTAEHDPVKINFISAPEEILLETPLEESQLRTTTDEVFFYGVNSKSEHLIAKIARGPNHEAEAYINIKLGNGKSYVFHQNSGIQRSCEPKVFSCDGLQMHYISPMRIWRIFYDGWLREKNIEDSTERMVHVKFALLWRSSSVVFDFLSDVDAGSLSNSLANTKWNSFLPPLEKLHAVLNFYAQCGIISGTIYVEGEEEQNIYLFGERVRYIGDFSIMEKMTHMHVFGQIHKDGSFVHLSQISIESIAKNLQFGFVADPLGIITPITDKTLDLQRLVENEEEEIKFHCKELEYTMKGKLAGKQMIFKKKILLTGDLEVQNFNMSLNSMNGAGFFIKGEKLKPPRNFPPLLKEKQNLKVLPLVAHFSEKVCQEASVTGGKGYSLGKLTEFSNKMKNFIVPEGIVVTTAAYGLFITKEVLDDIKILENVLYGNIPGDVKEICRRVMNKVSTSIFPDKVLQSIVNSLQKIFPDHEVLKFAVRSSATGEDAEGMSAAGQMDTFLGVCGLEKILSSVKKCWASQFSYTAVQYKRQNGQIINSPMAVVIQRMVPCDVAGVLFTCDPVTGNPTVMTITANYGLGESVVSASEEPDTIEIRRNASDQLIITDKIIGAKSRQIILQDTDGTLSEDVPAENREKCCLDDKRTLQLANLALEIEKYYRSPQDIEWGFWNNGLYIFQSRPVTTGFGATDFEIDHELDAPLRIENEMFSVSNLAEVMPGSMSTLSLDILPKYLQLRTLRDPKAQWMTVVPTTYFPQSMVPMHNRLMFYLINCFEHNKEDNEFNKVANVNFFGQVFEDEKLFEMRTCRFKSVKRDFVANYKPFLLFIKMFSGNKILKETAHRYDNFHVPVEQCSTSQEVFEALLYTCTDGTEAMECHAINTGISMLWNSFLLYFLMKQKGELNADVYREFAQLVQTKGGVVSADIPAATERLAYYIGKEKTPDEFKKMNIKEIREWLNNSQTKSGLKYREFLWKHEHRCLKEFDFRAKPWGMDPDPLIKLLKNLVGNVKYDPDTKKDNNEKILTDLGSNLSIKSRVYLKILIHFSRKGVEFRERAKSLLIKTMHAWRKGYYQLAKRMVSEGRIPDEDLLFFMTLDEIKELLATRSPKILSRAAHRRRRYPILDKIIFPEIMEGFPHPIDSEDDNEERTNEENFIMKGNPVSPGVAKAFIRVALSLEEAELLKPGEILLTYSTDIGWSPYFPILAGVVTEIGGLISHGAVVSREYGLPCIAGLRGATRQFKTGDYVLLDGNKGILQKLQNPENQEISF